MKHPRKLAAALVTLGAFSLPAAAYETGDLLLHLRAINIAPDDSSSLISVAGAPVAGTSVQVEDGSSLDISIGYMMSPNFAVSILLDITSEHEVNAFGLSGVGVPNGTTVIESRVLPPTVFAQYHFSPNSNIRPYVGAGVNYTVFLDDELTTAAKTVLGASNLDIDSSFGLAGQAGIDIDVGGGWFVSADVKYIQIETTATFDTVLGKASVDVDINPWVFGFGVGTTF